MQVGARVMVKDDPHFNGRRGVIRNAVDAAFGYDWNVMLDGSKVPVAFKDSQLVPLEVVVLEGKLGVSPLGADVLVDKHGIMHVLPGSTTVPREWDIGDDLRVTIERVKKEATAR